MSTIIHTKIYTNEGAAQVDIKPVNQSYHTDPISLEYYIGRSENMNTLSGYEKETICEFCKHDKINPNEKPCSTCVQWVDGYLTATNYNPSELSE